MYYNKNDFRSYLEGDSLTHYGVLGMKWGVHKAKTIDRDIAYNNKYNRDRRLKQAYKRGDIDKSDYKTKKRQSKSQYSSELYNINNDKYKNVKVDKNKSYKSIYEKSERKANRLMPHYTRNKRISRALQVAGILGAGVSGLSAGQSLYSLGSNARAASAALARNGYTSPVFTVGRNGNITYSLRTPGTTFSPEVQRYMNNMARAADSVAVSELAGIGNIGAAAVGSNIRRRQRRSIN